MELSDLIKQLKQRTDEKEFIEQHIESLRKDILRSLKEKALKKCISEDAEASYSERVKIVYKAPMEDIIKQVEQFDYCYQVIPEHREITKEFEKRIRAGTLKVNGVDTEVQEILTVKFKT